MTETRRFPGGWTVKTIGPAPVTIEAESPAGDYVTAMVSRFEGEPDAPRELVVVPYGDGDIYIPIDVMEALIAAWRAAGGEVSK